MSILVTWCLIPTKVPGYVWSYTDTVKFAQGCLTQACPTWHFYWGSCVGASMVATLLLSDQPINLQCILWALCLYAEAIQLLSIIFFLLCTAWIIFLFIEIVHIVSVWWCHQDHVKYLIRKHFLYLKKNACDCFQLDCQQIVLL